MPATGEHPATDKPVSHGSPVTLALAIAACIGVAGGGVAYGNAASRINTIETDGAKRERRIEKLEELAAKAGERNAVLEAQMVGIRQTVETMDGKLDRLLEQRGVRQVGGR